MNFKAIAFDLDDTLIDTTNLLIPIACRKIHTYLLSQGYTESFEVFELSRKDFVKTGSHKEFFKSLAAKVLPLSPDNLVRTLNRMFYEPDIPLDLPLMEGAEQNLIALRQKYQIFIVTAGVLAAQNRKLQQLGIYRYVAPENVLVVAEGAFVTKKAAFQKILSLTKIEPTELLSIGNRLSQEIRMAKQLNCRTCYFRYGEHADDTPQDHFEIPDFTIQSHKELVLACQL